MPYGQNERATMQGIRELTPAFSEFEHQAMNYLAVIIGNLELLQYPDYQAHAETLTSNSIEAAHAIHGLFKELHK